MYSPRDHSPINYGLYCPRRTSAQDRRVAVASLASALRNQRRSAWAADMSEGTNCILLAFSTLVGGRVHGTSVLFPSFLCSVLFDLAALPSTRLTTSVLAFSRPIPLIIWPCISQSFGAY